MDALRKKNVTLHSIQLSSLYVECLYNPEGCDTTKITNPTIRLCFTEIGCGNTHEFPGIASFSRFLRQQAVMLMVKWLQSMLQYKEVALSSNFWGYGNATDVLSPNWANTTLPTKSYLVPEKVHESALEAFEAREAEKAQPPWDMESQITDSTEIVNEMTPSGPSTSEETLLQNHGSTAPAALPANADEFDLVEDEAADPPPVKSEAVAPTKGWTAESLAAAVEARKERDAEQKKSTQAAINADLSLHGVEAPLHPKKYPSPQQRAESLKAERRAEREAHIAKHGSLLHYMPPPPPPNADGSPVFTMPVTPNRL
jgi:hypothetical protein